MRKKIQVNIFQGREREGFISPELIGGLCLQGYILSSFQDWILCNYSCSTFCSEASDYAGTWEIQRELFLSSNSQILESTSIHTRIHLNSSVIRSRDEIFSELSFLFPSLGFCFLWVGSLTSWHLLHSFSLATSAKRELSDQFWQQFWD